MAVKKSFVLRIDPDVLKMVERWAADEFRSTNGQLEWIIRNALADAGRMKKNLTHDNDSLENQKP